MRNGIPEARTVVSVRGADLLPYGPTWSCLVRWPLAPEWDLGHADVIDTAQRCRWGPSVAP